MLDILLIHPALRDYSKSRIINFSQLENAIYPPLALCYLAAVLRNENFSVQILDMDADKIPVHNIKYYLKKFEPQIVGISVNSITYHISLKLADEIKKYNNEIPVILGGIHPTICPDEVISEKNIDICVRGEGEYTLLELLQYYINKKGSLEEIDGIHYKVNGIKKFTKDRKLEMDLDKFPYPAVNLIIKDPFKKYFSLISKYNPISSLITSRGCPFNCSYCAKIFHNIRFRTPENIIGELKILVEKYKFKDIEIQDDTFNLNPKRLFKLFDLMNKEDLDFVWRAKCRPELLNRKICYYFKRAHAQTLSIGAETGSDRLLKFINKNYNTNQIRFGFKNAHRAQIETHGFFMVGIPTETIEDMFKTFNFIKELKPDLMQITVFTPLSGTELWDYVVENNLLDESVKFSDYLGFNTSFLNLPDLPKKTIDKLRRLNYIRFYSSLNFIKKMGTKVILNPLRFPKALTRLLKFHFSYQ